MRVCKCRFGVTHTLDEVFEADPVVKHVICDEGGVNNAYLGTPCVCPRSCLMCWPGSAWPQSVTTHTL